LGLPQLCKIHRFGANYGGKLSFAMEIQTRPPVQRPEPLRQQSRAEDRRTQDELAARRLQEQNAIDQRRQLELSNTRRAQMAQDDKGQQVDRYA
jgi:hypothetical protein